MCLQDMPVLATLAGRCILLYLCQAVPLPVQVSAHISGPVAMRALQPVGPGHLVLA